MHEIEEIFNAVCKSIGKDKCFQDVPVPLHEPIIGDLEKQHVMECLDLGWASSVGTYTEKFEEALQDICNVEYVIACVNGTAALHISLLLAGVKPDEEVLVPAITFVATANAVLYCNAIPHFTDVSAEDCGMDADRLSSYLREISIVRDNVLLNKASGRRIAAILPVHCFGYPCAIDRLMALSEEFDLPVIEDATEGLGSTFQSEQVGSFGKLGILSFNGNKIITTGGGGAILTNDGALAEKARHLTTTAKLPHKWFSAHDQEAYNYRMPSLNAAMGVGQIERLDEIIELKMKLHESYRDNFRNIKYARLLEGHDNNKPNHWLNTIILDGKINIDKMLEYACSRGIQVRPVWKLLPDLPFLSDCPRMNIDMARDLENRIVNLPSSPVLAYGFRQ